MAIAADTILEAWHSLCSNYDNSLADSATRQFLEELSRRDIVGDDRAKLIRNRADEFPQFFDTYDYAWSLAASSYDFQNEILLQSRCIDAAIGFWLHNKQRATVEKLPLDRIVSRTTYLANFAQVTPHVQHFNSFEFIVIPLGWQEFCHRYLSSFEAFVDGSSADESPAIDHCKPFWLNLAANLIASSVCTCDYFLVSMIEAVKANVDSFSSSAGDFSECEVSERASELCFAAQDFAFCHEVAHVIHGETGANPSSLTADEFRADDDALSAYKASWSFRPVFFSWISSDPRVRTLVGPIVFGFLNRALVCSRLMMSKKLAGKGFNPVADAELDEIFKRSRKMTERLTDLVKSDQSVDISGLDALIQALANFEMQFAMFLAELSESECQAAAQEARSTQTLRTKELAVLRKSQSKSSDS